jgi:hypothetical protein
MKQRTISDILRAEIAEVGSIKRVSRETGLPYAVVHGFATSGTDIQMPTVQALVDYFGLVLVKKELVKPPKKTAKKRPVNKTKKRSK